MEYKPIHSNSIEVDVRTHDQREAKWWVEGKGEQRYALVLSSPSVHQKEQCKLCPYVSIVNVLNPERKSVRAEN